MKTREIIDYAEENGFNSVKFVLKRGEQRLAAGKFLDAYFEFVQIPILNYTSLPCKPCGKSAKADSSFLLLS